MKNLTITLTDREVFAITNSGIKEPSRRKQFQAFGITKKIGDQMLEQLSPAEIFSLKEEWRVLKSELPAFTPKTKIKKIATKNKQGYVIKDF